MIDYERITANKVEIIPKKEVIYLSGPMSHCKSDPRMSQPDKNFGTFDALEGDLVGRGYEVLNPVRTQPMIGSEPGEKFDPDQYWRAALRKDLLSMLMAGVTKVVFLPPAHTARSTPEKPEFREWFDSSGACVEAFFALKLGCSFSQASKNEDGVWTLADVPHETVRSIVSKSQTLADIQREYSGPFVQQGIQQLPDPEKAILRDPALSWNDARTGGAADRESLQHESGPDLSGTRR